jgi:hypothetical protein
MFLLVASAALALHTTIVQPPAAAADVSLGAPAPVAELDTSKLKGIPERLAWSPDGSELYVQAVERDKSFNVKSTKHYVISTAAKGMRAVDQEPDWASKYWAWKSAQYSPAAAAFMIATPVPQQETVRATAAPMGGALARGGGSAATAGTTNEDAASAAAMTQIQTVYALRIKGETIGEWVNEPVTPGSNYTWAPKPIRLFAYARRGGGPLVVLDESGRKQELKGAEAAILPAWSDDGGRLAWLERSGKKKYALMIAAVTVSR